MKLPQIIIEFKIKYKIGLIIKNPIIIDLYQLGALPKIVCISLNIYFILNLFLMDFKRFLDININEDNKFLIILKIIRFFMNLN